VARRSLEDVSHQPSTVAWVRSHPAGTPWRPELPEVPDLPQVFSARIESRDPIPELDRAGRYRYRQYPDSNQAPHAEASSPVRRLQPYASPSDGMPIGWHLPLHDDNEVLISCLNNDPDQPMLVGTLSNPAHGSVVTEENAHQNLLHTFSGNKLAMDDWRDKSAITFCTFAGHTMLHFNADVAGHRVNLETGLGQMECYAKKTIATQSGDTLTETIGNDRTLQIENRNSTTTKQKEIHYQAATDGEITAADHIQMESGKNLELTAGQDLHLDITQSTRIHVHEQDAIIHIDSGSLTIQADGATTIEGDGQGTILFEQNGGGFKMAPNGDITIFGDEVSLEADEINFYGPVNKEITGPDAAPVPLQLAPLAAAPIGDLEAVSDSDSLIRPIYPVRYAYANFFKDKLSAPAIPPPLKDMLHKTDAAQTQGYVARLLRPGWIYIREEDGPDDGYFHIFKYEHIERDGDLQEKYTKYLFKNGINAQDGIKEDTSGGGFGYPYVFVRQEVTEISIAYSEHEWHPDVIDKMNGNSAERATAMQRMKLTTDDAATVMASSANFKALVEDYRDQQSRLLKLKTSDVDPDIKNLALDVLTTQAGYELDPDQIADEIRRNTNRGEVGRIVGLFDPVGRQRDIAEIHAKLVLWQKRFGAQNLYPYTIGTFVDQLRQNKDDEKLQDVLNDSINFEEFNEYWGNLKKTDDLFTERLKQFAALYKSFMHNDSLLGRVGSLDTYFEKFFSFDHKTEKQCNDEIQKLCSAVSGIFNGIASSKPGEEVLQSLHDDSGKREAFYGKMIKALDKSISTEKKTVFHAKTLDAIDQVFQQLGGFWGKVSSAFKNSPQVILQANYQANLMLCNNLLPKVFIAAGLDVPDGETVGLTTEKFAKLLAQHIDEGASHYPAPNPGKNLDKAMSKVVRYQKLFDWGQRSLDKAGKAKKEWHLSKVTQVPKPGAAPSGRFKQVAEGVGLFVEGSFAGIWTYFNVKALHDLAHQTNFDQANPIDRGNQFHDMLKLSTSIAGLTTSGLALSKSVSGLSEIFVGGLEAGAGRLGLALAPKLGRLAEGLGVCKGFFKTVIGTQLVSKVMVFLNLAAAIDSSFNAYRSYQQGNSGEMAGHISLGVGAIVFFYVACQVTAVTAEAAGVAGAPVSLGASVVVGTIIGVALTGLGGWLLYRFGKSDFQVLLENCFWGSGSKYMLWDNTDKRPEIQDRLDTALDLLGNVAVQSSYQIESQEFLNYFYQPQLKIEDNSFVGSIQGQFTYAYTFILPNFQPGVSEIECEIYGRERIRHNLSRFEPNAELQQKLYQAIKKAEFTEKDGQTTFTIKLTADRQVRLHWYYAPNSNIISPRRYLTKDGLITEPLIGMIDEETV
jgi:hypothetical protein